MHRGLFLGGGTNLSLGKTLVLGGIQQQGFITYQDQDQPWNPRLLPTGDRPTLILLTSVKFFGAGGQAPTKEWHYDYNTAESGWSWAPPHSNLLAPLLTSVKFFGQGGQAPTKQWRYDFDSGESFWPAHPTPSALLHPLLTAGGQPPTKLWQWHYDAEAAWQVAYHRNLILLAVPFGPVLWNFRYQEDANWAGAPVKSALLSPLLTAGGQPPTKRWRYDYDADSFWQFAPLLNQLLATPATNPFKHAQWNFTYSDDAAWQYVGSRNAGLFTAAPFALRAWRFGYDEPSGWTWSPRSSALLAPILTASGQPPTKQWRYDYDSAETFWQFQFPINFASFTFVARAQPFTNVWSYDYNYDIGESAWTWQAPASPPLYIVPIPPIPPIPPGPPPVPFRPDQGLGKRLPIIGETVNDPLNPQYSLKVNPDGSININVVTVGAPRPNQGQPALILGQTVNDKDNPEFSIKVNADGSINIKKA